MPLISRTRFKVIGHRIDGNKITHFTQLEAAPDALPGALPPMASIGGAPEIVANARAGVIPDDTIIEVVTKYDVLEVGAPPASEVVVTPPADRA